MAANTKIELASATMAEQTASSFHPRTDMEERDMRVHQECGRCGSGERGRPLRFADHSLHLRCETETGSIWPLPLSH